MIGRAVPRVEDERLLRGEGRFLELRRRRSCAVRTPMRGWRASMSRRRWRIQASWR
jgi:hypothetical protein